MRIFSISTVITSPCYLLLAIAPLAITGCAEDLASLRPVFMDQYFPQEEDPTTGAIVKPSQRIAELEAIGEAAGSKSATELQQISAALAKQIQREEDPLIRRAIVRTLAKLPTPLASAVLAAGLKDPDRDVRIACCQAIAARGGADAAAHLTQVLERDNSVDVRIAAIRALGKLRTASSLPSLVPALESRDPAIQLAAIDAARSIRTSQGASDLGNDVNAWLAYAQGQQPQLAPQPTPASPLQWVKRWVPGWN